MSLSLIHISWKIRLSISCRFSGASSIKNRKKQGGRNDAKDVYKRQESTVKTAALCA